MIKDTGRRPDALFRGFSSSVAAHVVRKVMAHPDALLYLYAPEGDPWTSLGTRPPLPIRLVDRGCSVQGGPDATTLGVSTHGRDDLVLSALESARMMGQATFGMCGYLADLSSARSVHKLSDLCYIASLGGIEDTREELFAALRAVAGEISRQIKYLSKTREDNGSTKDPREAGPRGEEILACKVPE